jgi:hypothetical protein
MATGCWWIVLAEIDGKRVERQLPATDKAEARRYFLATNTHWRGVRILSITLFGLNTEVLQAL